MPGEPLETFSAATRTRYGDGAQAWLDHVPDLIADVRQRWSLQLGDAATTEAAYLIDAERQGDPLLLELSFPDGWWPETTRALEAWGGDGTIRLLEHDDRGVRLVERHAPIPPGDESETLRSVVDVARRLWIAPPDGITSVAVEVRAWGSELPERHVKAAAS
jgi:streptomycin 6-kinase